MINEEWRDVVGFENLYQVSNFGNIRSKDVVVIRGTYPYRKKGRLKVLGSAYGYPTVSLSKDKHNNRYFVHRLVAKAFIPNPHDYPVINHKDENRMNNHVDNLEWCTQKYNMEYSHLKEKSAQVCSIPVFQFDFLGNLIKEYPNAASAAKSLGVGDSLIKAACYGANASAKGFFWRQKGRFIPTRQPLCKIVSQQSISDGTIRIHDNLTTASSHTGFAKYKIRESIRGNKPLGGFVWNYVDSPEIDFDLYK